jgi:hypothetical protein
MKEGGGSKEGVQALRNMSNSTSSCEVVGGMRGGRIEFDSLFLYVQATNLTTDMSGGTMSMSMTTTLAGRRGAGREKNRIATSQPDVAP